jgi:hypothetical protein
MLPSILQTKGITNIKIILIIMVKLPYILEYNLQHFYSFRGPKNQMQVRFMVESWILEK